MTGFAPEPTNADHEARPIAGADRQIVHVTGDGPQVLSRAAFDDRLLR